MQNDYTFKVNSIIRSCRTVLYRKAKPILKWWNFSILIFDVRNTIILLCSWSGYYNVILYTVYRILIIKLLTTF